MKMRKWWWICLPAALALFGLSDFLRKAGAQDAPVAEAPIAAKSSKADSAGGEKKVPPADEGEARSGDAAAAAAEKLEAFRTKEESYAGKIVVIKVGERDLSVEARFDFMKRILEKAQEEGASAVILDMDTPGGLAWESGKMIMNYLPKMTMPTYTFVNPNGASAGAIIAIGTDTIYMARPSSVGAAAAVMSTGGEIPETMAKKLDSYMRAQVRSVAKVKGHNPDIAEAFINSELEVYLEVGDEDKDKFPMGAKMISKKGELLSLDHEQATEIINGKPVFAKGIAKDLEDLVAQEGLKGEIVVAEPLGLESFALWVSRLAVVLIMLGVAGAYMEMQAPGFGIPGAISIVCFAIFFFGHYVAGNLAGFEVIAVFVLGLVLIAVEIFLLPGTLIIGLTGAVLMLGALVYTMAGTSIDGGAFSINLEGLGAALRNLALGLAGSVILVAVLLRFLPETRAMSWLILKTSVAGGASLGTAESSGDASVGSGSDGGSDSGGRARLVGKRGVTMTSLRPSGKGKFGNQTLDIVSEAEFVESGVEVRIVAQQGSRIVVAKV